MSSKGTIFKDVSKEDWMHRIEKDLKGKSLESMRLYVNGIELPRYAHFEDQPDILAPLDLDRPDNHWIITSRIRVEDPKRANAMALNELEGGVQALRFIINEFSPEAAELILENVKPELIGIHWTLSEKVNRDIFSAWWKEWIDKNEPNRHSISRANDLSTYDDVSKTLTVLGTDHLSIPDNSVQALEELVFQTISELKSLGENIFYNKQFSIRLITPVGSSLLWEIAKLRALRILMAHVALAFEIDEKCIEIETTGGKSITSLAPNDHKIATPIVAMACIAGEADAICLPIAESLEPEKELFHRRIARNVHHLMISESKMDSVIDPPAGSYFFEELTNNIAKSCWQAVQQKMSEA